MLTPGLVSVSFRALSPEEIVTLAKAAGLFHIEWGSDIHAPQNDCERLLSIAALQKHEGVTCCSYGTYFRFGVNRPEEITAYLDAAEVLGTRLLRVWCGTKGYDEYTAEERERIYADCHSAAEIAGARGMTLAAECHPKTLTDSLAAARELMDRVASPAFRMYWQPNQFRSEEENLAAARGLAPFVTQIHTFNWKGREKFPLAGATALWREYLSAFRGDHCVLLEFMPDGDPASLPAEADALRRILQ